MSSPTVYLERAPLQTMLLAAAEAYNTECLGNLFGSLPSRTRNSYRVRFAMVIQKARRTNSGVNPSKSADRRVQTFLRRVGRLYLPIIGDFHSHPANTLAKEPRETDLSGLDADGMATPDGRLCPLAVVIRITRHSKRAPWKRYNQKTRLHGSLGEFTFDVKAFRIVGEGDAWKVEALTLEISPSLRKALNKARRS